MRSASWLRCSGGVSGVDACGRPEVERFSDVGRDVLAMEHSRCRKGLRGVRSVLLIL